MKKIFIILILLPLISFSQNAIIKNLYPVIKHHRLNDSIKSIYYPLVNTPSISSCREINNTIKSVVFGVAKEDTSHSNQDLLNILYKKYKGLGLSYGVNYNKNGLLSLTIRMVTYCEDRNAPIYMNFDLGSGKLLTLKDLLDTKNDSVSMRQAIVPQMADSVRLLEQKIDKTNPKYSDIIEQLNSEIGTFSHAYPVSFVLTDTDMVFYLDCFIPSNIYGYAHTFKVKFPYKTLKNVLKKAIVNRLQ